LKIAHWDGSQWQIESIEEPDLYRIGVPSLAIDGSDNYHVAYSTSGLDGSDYAPLNYATWDGVKWNIETIDDREWGKGIPDLEIDELGRAHVAYDYRTVQHAIRHAGEWHISQVAPLKGRSNTSLAIHSDSLFIAFQAGEYNYDTFGLMLASRPVSIQQVYLPSIEKH
jgi:hypothetical protein